MPPEAPLKRGALIVVEGIDGAGKTTQVARLVELLKAAGEDVVASKEPTRGPWGQKIRESARDGRLAPGEELQAFVEDRRQHVRELIGPALARGAIVVLDRYVYSTIAYQGSHGGDVEVVREQMKEFPTPAIALVLDIDPKVGIARVSARDGQPNHFENVDQLSKARAIFLAMNGRISKHVDGSKSIEEVHREVLAHLVAADGPLARARCAKSYGCDGAYCSFRMTGECEWLLLRGKLMKLGVPVPLPEKFPN